MGDDKKPLGYNRALKLVETIYQTSTAKSALALVKELKALENYDKLSDRCDEFGVFTNFVTLEVDLFEGDYVTPIIETLREGPFGADRKALIDAWEAKPALSTTTHTWRLSTQSEGSICATARDTRFKTDAAGVYFARNQICS